MSFLVFALFAFIFTRFVRTNKQQPFCLRVPNAEQNECGDFDASESLRATDEKWTSKARKKYLLYEVNVGEGFNLRRDVYLRMASIVYRLKNENWTLVLPPFGPLYHWKSRRFQRSKLPWTLFFDIQSLNAIVPVIEFEQFLSEIGDQIDIVVALKHFDDNFDDRWYERFEIEYCEESKSYYKLSENEVRGWFFSYFDRVTASNLICLKIEGFTTTLKKFIRKQLSNYFSVFISNAEVILHKNYGDSLYWSIRRSMRFNRDLIAIGDEFRAKYLNSTNIQDKTTIESDWVHMRRNHGDALGGPFLAVHIRRDDFAKSRPKDVPTLDCAKEQIFFVAKKFSLELVFIASDMREEEWIQLTKGLFENYNLKVFRFKNDTLLDGQVAIVDQWICAHARVFIGKYIF